MEMGIIRRAVGASGSGSIIAIVSVTESFVGAAVKMLREDGACESHEKGLQIPRCRDGLHPSRPENKKAPVQR